MILIIFKFILFIILIIFRFSNLTNLYLIFNMYIYSNLCIYINLYLYYRNIYIYIILNFLFFIFKIII